MTGICTSPYPIEKVRDFPYPYPYPVNAGIPCQNGDGFVQYPWGRIYLSSLVNVEQTQERKKTITIVIIN